MSPTDTDLKKTQIKQLEAEIAQMQAQTIRTLVDAGRGYRDAEGTFDPTAVVQAVISSDLSLLTERRQPPSDSGPKPLIP